MKIANARLIKLNKVFLWFCHFWALSQKPKYLFISRIMKQGNEDTESEGKEPETYEVDSDMDEMAERQV